jgi:hypothetical protein
MRTNLNFSPLLAAMGGSQPRMSSGPLTSIAIYSAARWRERRAGMPAWRSQSNM